MPHRQAFQQLQQHIESEIIGQSRLVNRLLVALLADGHLLVEGPPGLAKTRAIHVLAQGIEADFHRVQFTPDLLPADLTGSDVYHPEDGHFEFTPGPLFHNLVLADEINRAPAKVQSALLEAMAEHQVTVGSESHKLPELFLVMATQNPIEQEGTYPLPEAQLDRFLLHVTVDYPSPEATRQILRLTRNEALHGGKPRAASQQLTEHQIIAARQEILQLHISESVEDYIIALVEATRNPHLLASSSEPRLADWIEWGASPRAAIAIERGSRALAWLDDRDFVTPEDVQNIAPDALRHRVLMSYEAEAEGIQAQHCVEALIQAVPAP